MNKEDGKRFRDTLREIISENCGADPVALLFSGGTDSLTILWTLLEIGVVPTCYHFHLAGRESPDTRAARLACSTWKVPLRIIQSGPNIKADVERTISVIRSARKTHVEVMYAYMQLLEAVTERHVFSGIQADTLYGSNKNAAIQCGKESAKEFAKYRAELLANSGQEGHAQANMIAKHFGKILITPYSDGRMRSLMMEWSWAELNRPRQKMPAVLGFAERYAEVAIYRHDDNLQCGSGIREHMEREFSGKQRAAYKAMLAQL